MEQVEFNKQMPQDVQAEKSCLGSMLIDNNCIPEVFSIIRPESFYLSKHQKTAKKILEMDLDNKPVDLITLNEALGGNGDNAYLMDLMQSTPSSANVKHHAKIIQKTFLLRDIAENSIQLYERATSKEDPEQLLEDIGRLSLIGIDTLKEHTFKELIHKTDDIIDSLKDKPDSTISTGIQRLDQIVGGFWGGQLVVIAAYTSQGKTALLTQIACNCAIRRKKKALIFSLEMEFKEMVQGFFVLNPT